MHRLFPAGEEALACRVSLRCHVDSALLRSVSLIETALQCETVAENPRCQVPAWGLGDCRIRQTYSRRDVLGCSREIREKNGSTTSKKKTVTTPTFIPRVLDDSRTLRSKKPHPASAFGVRTKKHQEPLDKTGSFRDVAPDGVTRFVCQNSLGNALVAFREPGLPFSASYGTPRRAFPTERYETPKLFFGRSQVTVRPLQPESDHSPVKSWAGHAQEPRRGSVALRPANGPFDQLCTTPGEKLVQHDRFLGLARPGRGGRRKMDFLGQVGQRDLRPSARWCAMATMAASSSRLPGHG